MTFDLSTSNLSLRLEVDTLKADALNNSLFKETIEATPFSVIDRLGLNIPDIGSSNYEEILDQIYLQLREQYGIPLRRNGPADRVHQKAMGLSVFSPETASAVSSDGVASQINH